VDLLDPEALPSTQFLELERLIAANAAQQRDLQVNAVYWRINDVPVTAAAPSTSAPATRVPCAPTPAASGRRQTPAFEPIGQDEMLAFKQAVATAAGQAAPNQTVTSGPRRQSSAPTGFEDTQILRQDESASPLSATQFGDL